MGWPRSAWTLIIITIAHNNSGATAQLERADAEYSLARLVDHGVVTTVSEITLPQAQTSPTKWAGVAFAPNTQRLYMAPFSSDAVLMVDPQTHATDTSAMGSLGFGGGKWAGLAYAPVTRKLYAAPYNSQSVLVIDPEANSTSTIISDLGAQAGKWFGIAFCESTSRLYAAPSASSSVLVVDPQNLATSEIAVSESGSHKWAGIAYVASVDKLYAAPLQASAVLIVDPVNETVDTATLDGLGSGPFKWSGIALAPTTNLLYAAPFNSDAVLVVDPENNTLDTTTLSGLDTQGAKWGSITFCAASGKLYAAPLQSSSVLSIDPEKNQIDLFGNFTVGVAKWLGIAVAPETTSLYAAPETAASVLSIRLSINVTAVAADRIVSEISTSMSAAEFAHTEAVGTSLNASDVDHYRRALLLATALGNVLNETQAQLSATQSSLVEAQANNTALSAVVAAGTCGADTHLIGGECLPDCTRLALRGVDCEPHCPTEPAAENSSNGTDTVTIASVVALCVIAVLVGIAQSGGAIWVEGPSQRDDSAEEQNPETEDATHVSDQTFVNPTFDGLDSDNEQTNPAQTVVTSDHPTLVQSEEDANSYVSSEDDANSYVSSEDNTPENFDGFDEEDPSELIV